MKITSFTIAGLLLLILAVHMVRNHSFTKLWQAAAGGGLSLAA